MKDHSVKDTIMRDTAVVIGLILFMYVSINITPISIETIISGEVPSNLLSFFGIDMRIAAAQSFFLSLQNFLGVLAVTFLAGIFWTTIKIREIHHAQHEKYEPIPVGEITAKEKMTQWQVILEHINSESPAEWKLAILEADNMLDEILEDQGYLGETLADKLKALGSSRIASYNELWEAHKLRNQIAHGGAIDMELTKKMAKDAVAQFGNAFKELGYL